MDKRPAGIIVLHLRANPPTSYRLDFVSRKANGAEDGIRTRDPLLGKEVLYH